VTKQLLQAHNRDSFYMYDYRSFSITVQRTMFENSRHQ